MVAKRYASHSAIADHHPAAIPRPRAVLVLCQCVCGDSSGSNSDSQFVVATSTYLSEPGREPPPSASEHAAHSRYSRCAVAITATQLYEHHFHSVYPRRATAKTHSEQDPSRRQEVRSGGPGVSPDISLCGSRSSSILLDDSCPRVFVIIVTFPSSARSLIRHRGRVLVDDVIVTGMERRDGGEGGVTERGWWRISLPLCEDSGLSCQVQLRWSR
ncbi:hypothetical protein ALC53_11627 [Atta colombica]|uniref:Uncharacterized protein n=1 Tax=Atta colombica TaxID=520822 RepID=A0A195B159_9HYME|nr:hypothetical protein ALC53_11627 [Atta colombica]